MIESIVSACVPSLMVGLVLAYWERKQRRQEQDAREKEQSRIESDMLRIDLEVATAQLSYAVAMAVKRGRPNGEMETAIEKYEKAMDKFRKFERKQLAISNNE